MDQADGLRGQSTRSPDLPTVNFISRDRRIDLLDGICPIVNQFEKWGIRVNFLEQQEHARVRFCVGDVERIYQHLNVLVLSYEVPGDLAEWLLDLRRLTNVRQFGVIVNKVADAEGARRLFSQARKKMERAQSIQLDYIGFVSSADKSCLSPSWLSLLKWRKDRLLNRSAALVSKRLLEWGEAQGRLGSLVNMRRFKDEPTLMKGVRI